jgi:hypothetical protein
LDPLRAAAGDVLAGAPLVEVALAVVCWLAGVAEAATDSNMRAAAAQNSAIRVPAKIFPVTATSFFKLASERPDSPERETPDWAPAL